MSEKVPTISLCMIARNEEEWIEQCIKSVQPIVSEVILVDTGSTDRTVTIAESLGATVLFRTWDDDFAAPRNVSIQHACGDWILVLDADEAIAERDLAELKKYTSDPTRCYEFMQRHYTSDVRLSGFRPIQGIYPDFERDHPGYFESNLVRFFPRHPELAYRGRVHELVEHSIYEAKKYTIYRSSIPIHHYGHTEQVRKKKNKGSLYTPLGTQKLKDNPTDWKGYFELGVEHNVNGRKPQSVEAFVKAAELNPGYVQTWVNLGYVLCELQQFASAEDALKTAIRLDARCSDAWCNLGVVYMRAQHFPQAESSFRRALALDPTYINAYCNLGKTLAFMSRVAEAVAVLRHAVELMPQCVSALLDLGALYLASKLPLEAQKYLTQATLLQPDLSQAHYYLAQSYKIQNNHAAAIEALDACCAIETKAPNLPPEFRQKAFEERDGMKLQAHPVLLGGSQTE